MQPGILVRIASGETLLGDGGMGTLLADLAGRFDCPERLVLEAPDVVASAHAAFFEAGSDLVETDTFGGTRARLKLHGLDGLATEISRKAAEIARSVCPQTKGVLGSIGPTGEILEPFGDALPEDISEMFAEQAAALAEGGVDAIIIETMMDAEEARLAVQAAKSTTDLPVIATMTFATSPTGIKTRWGIDPATAAKVLEEAGADLIGSNCGNGFGEMLAVMEEMRAYTSLPLVAQANAGVPVMKDGVPRYLETPEEIEPKAQALLSLGLAILGGCCGTRPEHIRVMRRLIDGS